MEKYKKEIEIYDYLGEYENSSYEKQMKMLKDFLLLSGEYSLKLDNGEDINDIYKRMATKNKLKCIDKKGIYYYKYDIEKTLMQREMLPWDKEEVDKHIYAIAYAFFKSDFNCECCRIEIIRQKILEMTRNARDSLFYSDLIYYIKNKAKLSQKQNKEIEDRIQKRKEFIENKTKDNFVYEISEFDMEICEFLNEISEEIGNIYVDESDLSNYPILVDKKLKQYNKFIRN